MSASDKAKAKAQEAKGRAKEAAGGASGDKNMEAEGRAERTKGSMRQAAQKAKDAFKH
ncbi:MULTISPECIES: CsbD family protein [unclassified Streptomyces]|uniref:CsbD family protein n=1 Tax=unclassified Streptomyces TaxID=2593676 RepID=UPI002E29B766|nr:CsbD family protein [Streptomyces sp. NBC_00223]